MNKSESIPYTEVTFEQLPTKPLNLQLTAQQIVAMEKAARRSARTSGDTEPHTTKATSSPLRVVIGPAGEVSYFLETSAVPSAALSLAEENTVASLASFYQGTRQALNRSGAAGRGRGSDITTATVGPLRVGFDGKNPPTVSRR